MQCAVIVSVFIESPHETKKLRKQILKDDVGLRVY